MWPLSPQTGVSELRTCPIAVAGVRERMAHKASTPLSHQVARRSWDSGDDKDM